ncbi:hypothetical protein [Hoylesella timonensis]|uniref:Uncharacterized protein n=1 Tax=Hoylesella timonensis S9-PR14 TaxID=1401062 RepID=A0A098YPR2_9BACT|nr:hypothetical protein [Hoylesella timonensis]KGI21247.1 hypothetical protein HMPREF9304_11340 [Hoylesella timonensis S9-PR14]
MGDTIFQILQWAIPSGGIGAAIAWIANRRLRTVEEKKKIEDTYKQMYDMVSRELISLQQQNETNYDKIENLRTDGDKMRRALNRLSRAIEAIQICPHRTTCPVSVELSLDQDSDAPKPARGKPTPAKGQPHTDDHPNMAEAGEGSHGNSLSQTHTRQHQAAATRSSVHGKGKTGGCQTPKETGNGE